MKEQWEYRDDLIDIAEEAIENTRHLTGMRERAREIIKAFNDQHYYILSVGPKTK